MSDYLKSLLLDTVRPVHDGLQAEFGVPGSIEADCLSMGIKIQESGLTAVRDQGDPAITGPATGLWQFEKGGGIWEVLNSPKIAPIFIDLCGRAGVRAEADTVWRFFTTAASDQLAAAAARLVMYLDPSALPPATVEGGQAALAYYLRRWRPAKNDKREQDFLMKAWPAAVSIVQANPRTDTPSLLPAAGIPAAVPGGPLTAPDIERRLAAAERQIALLDAWVRRYGA